MTWHPLQYLNAGGGFGHVVTPLLWWSIGVSIVVTVIITVLVLWGVLARRAGSGRADLRAVAIDRVPGVRWIWIGVAISLVPLAVSLVWTVAALASVGPVPPARVTIDVTAHQWWWDVTYSGARADDRFQTANEIHIPTGEPVLVRLHSADVIHSFWVPQLAGKTDLIPGQVNLMWVKADRPGLYRGQCAEFCGYQHAHMAFQVVADRPQDFARWRAAQLLPAPEPANPVEAHGRAVLEYRCAICHAVRGTLAGSHAAPDLTHLMSRRTIAAGTLPNNVGSLSGWIENPQAVKPGAMMPPQALSAGDLNDLRAYLGRLK